MIKIEVLYNEVCNFFGDTYNIKYLKENIKDVEVIYTNLVDKPKFINEKENINMVYISPMSEKYQEVVIEKLKPYTDKIKNYINNDKILFAVGNALEIFGDYILKDDKTKIEGLHITHLHSKIDMMHRHNSLYYGRFDNIKIIGFKSQFSMSYGKNQKYLFDTDKGIGINQKSKKEGIRIKNFFGTYILGPIFILNPLFTKYILGLLGVETLKLKYDEEIMKCYEERLKEFENII